MPKSRVGYKIVDVHGVGGRTLRLTVHENVDPTIHARKVFYGEDEQGETWEVGRWCEKVEGGDIFTVDFVTDGDEFPASRR